MISILEESIGRAMKISIEIIQHIIFIGRYLGLGIVKVKVSDYFRTSDLSFGYIAGRLNTRKCQFTDEYFEVVEII